MVESKRKELKGKKNGSFSTGKESGPEVLKGYYV